VRYDTSHGFAHRDLLNIKGEKRKTPLFITDKNDALTFAENDIQTKILAGGKKVNEGKLIEKNISLSIEFSKYIFEHPELEDKIPKGAQVVLLPEYDEELSAYNLMIAEKQREEGRPVVYVRIEKLLTPRLSRVSKAELEIKHG
jgi:hypothetical protein